MLNGQSFQINKSYFNNITHFQPQTSGLPRNVLNKLHTNSLVGPYTCRDPMDNRFQRGLNKIKKNPARHKLPLDDWKEEKKPRHTSSMCTVQTQR